VQLTAPDIDGMDATGVAFQQHLRKSAGRSADIETEAAGRIEAEMVQRRRQFDPAARNVRMCRRGADGCIDRDLVRRLANDGIPGVNEAGFDCRLGLGAAVEQAALSRRRSMRRRSLIGTVSISFCY
jgi:hypothetical protein